MRRKPGGWVLALALSSALLSGCAAAQIDFCHCGDTKTSLASGTDDPDPRLDGIKLLVGDSAFNLHFGEHTTLTRTDLSAEAH
jgi:hypothetical protein